MNLKEMLINEKIVKTKNKSEEPFILNKIGIKSRIFFDIKEACLNPEILRRITQNIIQSITQDIPNLSMTHAHLSDCHLYLFDKIGSIAIGGIPIATSLSLKTNIHQIIIRNDEHDRGIKNRIVGNCKKRKVLFIEDVSVTGDSIIKGVKAIREAGGICNTCIVVVDREEGAIENCKQNNITLYPLLNKSDFGIKE